MNLLKRLFACKHPASALAVASDQTQSTDRDPEFCEITLHLFCVKCGEHVDITYAKPTQMWHDRWEALMADYSKD